MHPVFVDSPETQAWLDSLASVPEEDKNRIQIPDAATWRRWLEYVEVPDEDIEAVIDTTPSVNHEPELLDILQRSAAQIIAHMGEIDPNVKLATLADFNDPRYRYFYVQLFAACLPFVQQYHRSLGIPDETTQATVADLGRNIRVHRKREGVGGLGVMWWLMLHFRGTIYQLGRLQFERQNVGEEVAASMRAHGHEADASTPALSIHIPDFMGPMDHDACTASVAQAVAFFSNHFPDWPLHTAICNSWLLDPALKTVLKPTSNIILFQNRWTLVDGGYDSSESVMQFVFGKHVRDLDTITPQSSLERGVIAHLRDGKEWQGRSGWFTLPEVE